jgi:hypothetical protein
MSNIATKVVAQMLFSDSIIATDNGKGLPW